MTKTSTFYSPEQVEAISSNVIKYSMMVIDNNHIKSVIGNTNMSSTQSNIPFVLYDDEEKELTINISSIMLSIISMEFPYHHEQEIFEKTIKILLLLSRNAICNKQGFDTDSFDSLDFMVLFLFKDIFSLFLAPIDLYGKEKVKESVNNINNYLTYNYLK